MKHAALESSKGLTEGEVSIEEFNLISECTTEIDKYTQWCRTSWKCNMPSYQLGRQQSHRSAGLILLPVVQSKMSEVAPVLPMHCRKNNGKEASSCGYGRPGRHLQFLVASWEQREAIIGTNDMVCFGPVVPRRFRELCSIRFQRVDVYRLPVSWELALVTTVALPFHAWAVM